MVLPAGFLFILPVATLPVLLVLQGRPHSGHRFLFVPTLKAICVERNGSGLRDYRFVPVAVDSTSFFFSLRHDPGSQVELPL